MLKSGGKKVLYLDILWLHISVKILCLELILDQKGLKNLLVNMNREIFLQHYSSHLVQSPFK